MSSVFFVCTCLSLYLSSSLLLTLKEPRNRFQGINPTAFVAWRASTITISYSIPSPYRMFKKFQLRRPFYSGRILRREVMFKCLAVKKLHKTALETRKNLFCKSILEFEFNLQPYSRLDVSVSKFFLTIAS